jgi:catabolite regulation protein CreA
MQTHLFLNGTPRQLVASLTDPRLHAVSCEIALNLVLQAHARLEVVMQTHLFLNGTPRQLVASLTDPRLHAVSCEIALNLVLQAHARGAKSSKHCRQLQDLVVLGQNACTSQVE